MLMKSLFAGCLALCASLAWSAGPPAASQAAPVIKGEVLEVKEVESYSYLRLKTKEGETWAAVGKSPIKKGAEVTIENVMVMNNFESKSLKKTFPKIIFGTLAGAGTAVARGPATAHAGLTKSPDVADVKVPKAAGPDARTVFEVLSKGADLKNKTVLVRGKVVKYSAGIMGNNWIHLRDGSGSASDNTNDVVVTTKSEVKPGDIVTLKGVVHTEKDFGSGYFYKVLIEEATLQK